MSCIFARKDIFNTFEYAMAKHSIIYQQKAFNLTLLTKWAKFGVLHLTPLLTQPLYACRTTLMQATVLSSEGRNTFQKQIVSTDKS